MNYALIIWLLGGGIWLDADPMTEVQCLAVMGALSRNAVVYVAPGLPPAVAFGCYPIEDT